MQSSIVHRLCWGMTIVAVGVIFLLNQMGVITMDIGELFSTFWPIIMIIFGLQGLLMQRAGGFWWNPLVILLGFFFLGRNLNWINWGIGELIHFIWPIALILFGIGMIFQGKRPRKADKLGKSEQWNPINPPIPPMPPGPPPAPPELDEFERPVPNSNANVPPIGPNLSKLPFKDNDQPPKSNSQHNNSWKQRHEHADRWKEHNWSNPNRINHSRFIGDVHLGNDYWELRPMSISHFIGDTTLDLTKAQIPIGETRVYVSSFIGDVKVFVPNDFGVGIQVVSSCLIGDVKVLDQKRGGVFNQMSVETPSYADTDKRVVLVVSSFIGDVRVTKVG
ncbi:cell wall-active antibiotics response protein LiaF [Cohnella sp.]|uniref:cell wall-active antibiotics response protein LiaF n=1 Tax=Cohnella sp. TaxID=1883426 RepID=UPI003566DE0E